MVPSGSCCVVSLLGPDLVHGQSFKCKKAKLLWPYDQHDETIMKVLAYTFMWYTHLPLGASTSVAWASLHTLQGGLEARVWTMVPLGLGPLGYASCNEPCPSDLPHNHPYHH